MTRVGIFASIGLTVLVMSCAGEKNAPRGRDTGKKSQPARATRPTGAAPPRTGPSTAPAPATTRAAQEEMAKILRSHIIMRLVVLALERFEVDIGRYPTVEERLEALVKRPAFDDQAVAQTWRGPYVKKLPLDPWGRPFHYEPVNDRKARRPYRLWSAGPDGVSGTSDDARQDRPPLRTALATALVPKPNWRQMARIDETRVILVIVGALLDRYNVDVGHYPSEDEGGLEALLKKPEVEDDAMARNWRGPYVKAMPKDAWGTALSYERVEDPKADPRYRIWSNGPDRQSGTDDDIRKWLDW